MAPRTCSYHVNSSLVVTHPVLPWLFFCNSGTSVLHRGNGKRWHTTSRCAVDSDVLRSFWEWRILRQLPHESSQNCLELLSEASPSTCLITISLWELQSWLHRCGPACDTPNLQMWRASHQKMATGHQTKSPHVATYAKLHLWFRDV